MKGSSEDKDVPWSEAWLAERGVVQGSWIDNRQSPNHPCKETNYQSMRRPKK